MAKIDYIRPPVYPYQRAILDSPARYTVCEASTKVGKTASHIIWIFEQALQCKANQSCWWVAPTVTQAKIAYDRMKVQITDKSLFTSNETNRVITLITGAKIEFKTAERPDNLYGDDVYAVVFDEFTRAREEAWFALRSTITSTGGKCKFIGNVKGSKNWGHKLAMKAKTGEDPNYQYFKITAYDAADAGMLTKDGRMFIDEINDAKRDLPESVFKELYLAEASEDGNNPFGLQHIRRNIYPLSTNQTEFYGIDLAKYTDYTAIIGMDALGGVTYVDRFQNDWKQTKERIILLPDKPTMIDSTGVGDPIVEDVCRVRQNTVGVRFTSLSKQQMMEGLAYSIQNRAITYPDGVIVDELEQFEFEYTRSGVKYTAPPGVHDDCVCGLALVDKCRKEMKGHGTYNVAFV